MVGFSNSDVSPCEPLILSFFLSGTFPGRSDLYTCTPLPVLDPTQQLYDLKVTIQNLTRWDHLLVYHTIRVRNGANSEVSVVSAGMYLHFTPPIPGLVRNGQFGEADARFSPSTETVHCNWANFDPGFVALDHYEVAIGTAPGMQDIVPFTNVGKQVDATSFFLDLQQGRSYYQSVKVRTRALHRWIFGGN
jgi:hypothetical protein